MEMETIFENNQLNWNVGGTPVTSDMIEPLAKELFGDLIRVASGTMSESELFAHPATELKLGETLAVGYRGSTAAASVGRVGTCHEASEAGETPDKVSAAGTELMQAIAEALIVAAHEKEKAEVLSDTTSLTSFDYGAGKLTALKKQVGDPSHNTTTA